MRILAASLSGSLQEAEQKGPALLVSYTFSPRHSKYAHNGLEKYPTLGEV